MYVCLCVCGLSWSTDGDDDAKRDDNVITSVAESLYRLALCHVPWWLSMSRLSAAARYLTITTRTDLTEVTQITKSLNNIWQTFYIVRLDDADIWCCRFIFGALKSQELTSREWTTQEWRSMRCPPMFLRATLSTLAMSTSASSCWLVHYRVVNPCFFASATLSTPAISVAPLFYCCNVLADFAIILFLFIMYCNN